ncbi:MAG TPA: DUF1549 domain-containing protein, partial [Gemmataceae bacterium]|nr:DUF1549 domain-containing protein [Gemmataceae bacterium]
MFRMAIIILAGCASVWAAEPGPSKTQSLSPKIQGTAPDLKGVSIETPSFRRHVVPLLGRLGCNGRACHGSFQGQGGFRLSLFGYDHQADHKALTDRGAARVNLEYPEDSLILEKPTLSLAHKGGKRYEKGGWEYHLLKRWIEAGARNDAGTTGRLDRLVVTPDHVVFQKPNEKARLRVSAHWSDGTAEDVTALARFSTGDEAVALVDPSGLVECKGPGDTHVVAFYDSGIGTVPVMLPSSDRLGDRYPEVPTPTRIDELVQSKLRQCGIVPSELCADQEFLRRVSLDLTGSLPRPEEVEAFLADQAPDKRARKIDELLARPTYAEWWTTRLCDLTGNNGQYREGVFAADFTRQWYAWIYRRVLANTGYDEIVKGIVLGN